MSCSRTSVCDVCVTLPPCGAIASRSIACESSRPLYVISIVSGVLRSTGAGRLTITLFWPETRSAMSGPSPTADTDETESGPASRNVSVPASRARVRRRKAARPLNHDRSGSNARSSA